jgi:amino acid adenylation domain-containing protein/thioester reductase-like protein
MSQLTQRLAQLSPEMHRQLLERIQGREASLPFQSIPSVTRDTTIFPLSFAQRRLWFLEQLEPGNTAYTIATAIHLEGAIHVALLEQSFTHLLQRHESLRTTFTLHQGQPAQIIHPASAFMLAYTDLSSLPADERALASERMIQQETQIPFSLEQGPLLRAQLCQLGEQEYILMLTMHHIISDGWSMSILVQEVTTHYGYLLQGQAPALPELPIQYVDYTLWQQRQLQGALLQKQIDYWRTRLTDAPVLELPTDYPRPAQRSYHGALSTSVLPGELARALRQVSQQEQVTLTMTMLAAFGVLLARYSGQQDLVVGMPIANRTRTEVEHLIGLFINTLALRLDLSGDPDFLQVLQRVRETSLSADAHQDIPFEKLVEELQPQRSLSQTPFFQVMFIPQNQPAVSFELPGLRIRNLRPDRQAAMFDLSLYVFEQDQEIELCAEYNTDLFTETTIARILRHYANILKSSAANPYQNIWQLPLLSEDELQQQLIHWNETQRSFPGRRCLHKCVEACVERSPNAVAVSFGEYSLTYRELEQRSNRLAHYLQRRGVGPGCLVGILLERSLDMVVGLLGILKAGGAYVPLDPEYPVERLSYVVQDSGLQVLLTQEGLLNRVGSQPTLEIVSLERDRVSIAQEKKTRPVCEITEQDLAYVLYTSGSTGRPKGVQIPHAAVVNFLCSMREKPGLHANDILLAVTTISFDIAGLEIFLPLTTGARVILLSRESALDGKVLAGALEESGATMMQATPATWRLLLEAGWQGKPDLTILCGGEALTRDLADQLLSKGASLWNLYGPTETTIWSTLLQVEAGDGPVSIGRPIANTQVYVLDTSLAPVPVGVTGDVYIGGTGVARGYLNRPELTAERFIPDPFSTRSARRLYKTGDRGCYCSDGTLLYLGRSDQQIKLHGFRIEPGEIEAVLTRHQDVQAAVVLVREDRPGNQRLVAYVLPKLADQADEAEMRTWLKKHLPDYMLPSVFLVLEAFPLTPNGKIDRRALPSPDAMSSAEELEAPRNNMEYTIVALWQQLLDIKEIGIRQNFFELGGHSLIAPQLIARINETFQVELPLRAIFAAPTIAELAQMITATREGNPPVSLTPIVDLQAEVVLDADIRLPQLLHPQKAQVENIFLTGATGFLGAYLLSDLLQQTRATIFCLVRSSTIDSGKRKLQEHLLAHHLWNVAYEERIVPVPGNLAQPLLGLSSQAFTLLAEQIGSIYHSGAWVNFTYPYQALKASNVLGTQEILRLASQAQAPVHLVSTLGIFSPENYPQPTILKEDTLLEDRISLNDGYAQSKWVAEKITLLARSRGIVANIYRPGIISAHSQTGVGNTTDLIWAALKGCIQIGSAPQIERTVNLAPVDYVSKAIVHLSLQKELFGQTFHLFNPQTIQWNDLVHWTNSLGYPVRHIPYKQWRNEVLSAMGDTSSGNAFQPFRPLLEQFDADQASASQQQLLFDDRLTQTGLKGSAITCPGVDEHLLKTYFSYFVQSGFLPAVPATE